MTKEVFSACPTAALYSRAAFLNVGGFDEDYFSYFEDVDLGFRLRLNGEKCLYAPQAVVHHVGSASTGKSSDFSVYYGYRNMIWTFFKDMPIPLFWLCLPLHLVTLTFFVIYLSWRGQGKVILRAIFDAARGLPKVLAKRWQIQHSRKVGASKLLPVMSKGLFEPYREFMQRNRAPARSA
jgi:GT2 family glycosyltransferase